MEKNQSVSLDESFKNLPDDFETFEGTDFDTVEEKNLEETEPAKGSNDESKPSEKKGETEEKKDEPSQEGENTPDENDDPNLPFHKHPRWVKRTKEINQMHEQLAEKDELIESLKQGKAPAPKATEDEDLPQWYKDLAGDDDVAKRAYGQMMETMTEKAMQTMMQRQQAEFDQVQKANSRLISTVTSGLRSINDAFGIDLISNEADRTEFLQYLEELAPKNTDGSLKIDALPNFVPAFEKWNKSREKDENKEKPNTIIKKKVAGLTKQSSQGAPASDDKKPLNVSGMGWGDWRKMYK